MPVLVNKLPLASGTSIVDVPAGDNTFECTFDKTSATLVVRARIEYPDGAGGWFVRHTVELGFIDADGNPTATEVYSFQDVDWPAQVRVVLDVTGTGTLTVRSLRR